MRLLFCLLLLSELGSNTLSSPTALQHVEALRRGCPPGPWARNQEVADRHGGKSTHPGQIAAPVVGQVHLQVGRPVRENESRLPTLEAIGVLAFDGDRS